jgi:hypothetical protein
MSGKLDNLTYTTNAFDPRLAKAMCEGRSAKKTGVGSNPHPVGSEEYTAWNTGYNNYNTGGTFQARDCCADLPRV